MTRDQVETKIAEILDHALGIDRDEIASNALIQRDLGADSLDMLEIKFRLGEVFDLNIREIEFDNISNMLTVSGLVDFINTKLTK